MTIKSALSASALALTLTAGLTTVPAFASTETASKTVQMEPVSVEYMVNEHAEFTDEERAAIEAVLLSTYEGVRELFPELTDHVNVQVGAMDRDLSVVGGVTGRADAPGEIVIYMSSIYPGGIMGAVESGLASTFSHELHHLVRGWTINHNQFGPGIHIAMVNEGLANVFSEELTGSRKEGNQPPSAAIAEEWAAEIMELPVNANYGEWMFMHPDGRMAVGYRAGTYIIRKAMAESGLSIEEISELSIEEIHALAGLTE